MDAPPLMSERERELAELRSRAYGPDADIDRDADALARLVELEEWARADSLPAADQQAREREQAAPVEDGDASGPSSGPDALTAAPRARWWRRVPVSACIAVAAVIGLGAGLALPGLAPPRPAAILGPAPFIDGVELDFELYGITAESPVRYEPFHGLEVWSGVTDAGSHCVVVTTGSGEWMAAGCAPEPLDATADIGFYPGMRPVDGLELATGSVVRFVLHDDVMQVWVAETRESA